MGIQDSNAASFIKGVIITWITLTNSWRWVVFREWVSLESLYCFLTSFFILIVIRGEPVHPGSAVATERNRTSSLTHLCAMSGHPGLPQPNSRNKRAINPPNVLWCLNWSLSPNRLYLFDHYYFRCRISFRVSLLSLATVKRLPSR